MADAKRRIGDRVCLIGNLQYNDLARGTPEQVERMAREAIKQGGAGGVLILSPCAYPYERSLPERASKDLIRYLEAGRKFGRYGARG